MQLLLKLIFIITLLFFGIIIDDAKAASDLLETYEKDVTGDHKNEKIELFGVPFAQESNYYQQIYAVITSGDQQWRINYQGGYDPVLLFQDVNHDGIDDLIYQSATGGSGGLYQSQLNTLAQKSVSTIPLPEQSFIAGKFIDGFYAEMTLNLKDEPIKVNVKSRKEDYIRLNIYDKKGNVKKAQQLLFDPIAFFEPFYISERKGYGLKSYQQISGAYHADRLGVVEALWYYEGDQWVRLKMDWKPVDYRGD